MNEVITIDYIVPKVKTLLPFVDEESVYDDQIDILVNGAINKLRGEGVDINAVDKDGNYFFTPNSYMSSDYVICLAYQILKDMDLDSDYNFMTEQYITRVNTLRCYVSHKQN